MNGDDSRRWHVLIADDEPLFGRTTAELLRKAGFEVAWVEDGAKALAAMRTRQPDLAVIDLNMPGNLGLELLFECRRSYPQMPVVVLTGRPTLPSAIESVRLGIHDYLLKPIEIDDLVHSLRRALPASPSEPPGTARPAESMAPGPILGESPAARHLRELIRKVARTSANVLVHGENGTGKELVAREVHAESRRGAGPFVVVDCSAIPESLLESTLFGHVRGAFTGATAPRVGLIKAADGGTAFFDEIGELPMPLQAKLLRLIQFGTFLPVGSSVEEKSDIRVVAATNRDLPAEIAAGRFRQDLYYRLAVLEIEVPPLRERAGDVLLLGNAFLAEIAEREGTKAKSLSPEAAALLQRHPWPGNVRELRNVMERVACLGGSEIVTPADLPESVTGQREPVAEPDSKAESTLSAGEVRERSLRSADHAYLDRLMKKHGGNVTAAAREAGLSRQGLHKCLKRAGLDAAHYRR